MGEDIWKFLLLAFALIAATSWIGEGAKRFRRWLDGFRYTWSPSRQRFEPAQDFVSNQTRGMMLLPPQELVAGVGWFLECQSGRVGPPESRDSDQGYVNWLSRYLSHTRPGFILPETKEIRLVGGPYDGTTLSIQPELIDRSVVWPVHRSMEFWALYVPGDTVYATPDNGAVSDHTKFTFAGRLGYRELLEKYDRQAVSE